MAKLHAERRANPIQAGALGRVADWQAKRLGMTYADLAVQPRYAGAIAFFQADLYGGDDFAQRDADLARIVPVMVRMLPARVIATVAHAMELNALSHELDRSLLARLPRADGQFSVPEYCRGFRKMGNRPARERQVALIVEIGTALDGYVKKPLIRAAMVMMRQPARLAGLGALHDFLERGFNAFRRMGAAAEFLEAIATRETALLDSIYAGDAAPFPDPLGQVPAPSPRAAPE
ncbi:MAG: hypothetical protein ABI886_05880 [Betaproteobacteria bacterium]